MSIEQANQLIIAYLVIGAIATIIYVIAMRGRPAKT